MVTRENQPRCDSSHKLQLLLAEVLHLVYEYCLITFRAELVGNFREDSGTARATLDEISLRCFSDASRPVLTNEVHRPLPVSGNVVHLKNLFYGDARPDKFGERARNSQNGNVLEPL